MRVVASNANIVNCKAFSWTMLHFCNVCNCAKNFLAFVVHYVVILREMQQYQCRRYFFG